MGERRTKLRETLKSFFPAHMEPHIYFQPPSGHKLEYPCFIYHLSDMPQIWANNKPYKWEKAYEVEYITRDPEDPMRDKVIALPKCRWNRTFTNGNLHHYVYIIFE